MEEHITPEILHEITQKLMHFFMENRISSKAGCAAMLSVVATVCAVEYEGDGIERFVEILRLFDRSLKEAKPDIDKHLAFYAGVKKIMEEGVSGGS